MIVLAILFIAFLYPLVGFYQLIKTDEIWRLRIVGIRGIDKHYTYYDYEKIRKKMGYYELWSERYSAALQKCCSFNPFYWRNPYSIIGDDTPWNFTERQWAAKLKYIELEFANYENQ